MSHLFRTGSVGCKSDRSAVGRPGRVAVVVAIVGQSPQFLRSGSKDVEIAPSPLSIAEKASESPVGDHDTEPMLTSVANLYVATISPDRMSAM